MKEAEYVNYAAHMLDESAGDAVQNQVAGYGGNRRDLGGRSYLAAWQSEFPEYGEGRIAGLMAKRFDAHVRKIPGIKDKLAAYAAAFGKNGGLIPYERAVAALVSAFRPDELTDRSWFWELIPARTYKAMVSRNAAKHAGTWSRDVSPKTVKDCLDSICASSSILAANGKNEIYDRISRESFAAGELRKAGGLDGDAAAAAVCQLYRACSSYCTYRNHLDMDGFYRRMKSKYPGAEYGRHFDEIASETSDFVRRTGAGDWLANDTDSGLGEDILDFMRTLPYDVYERPDDAIPVISMLIDRAHIRGDLAGAYVEDGANTCSSASSMKPDELYEGGKPNTADWVLVTDISPKRAKWLLSHSAHDVSRFSPGNVRKALAGRPSANSIYGLFSRYDHKNALALAVVIRDYGPEPGCVYLHEMTGFKRGGAGRVLVQKLAEAFPKVWMQCEPVMNSGKSSLNDGLADGVYRRIPGLKEYVVGNSVWNGPANFFYSGIGDGAMAEYLERSYGARTD